MTTFCPGSEYARLAKYEGKPDGTTSTAGRITSKPYFESLNRWWRVILKVVLTGVLASIAGLLKRLRQQVYRSGFGGLVSMLYGIFMGILVLGLPRKSAWNTGGLRGSLSNQRAKLPECRPHLPREMRRSPCRTRPLQKRGNFKQPRFHQILRDFYTKCICVLAM